MGNHHKMSLQDLVVVLSEVYGVYKKIAVSKYDEVEGGKFYGFSGADQQRSLFAEFVENLLRQLHSCKSN